MTIFNKIAQVKNGISKKIIDLVKHELQRNIWRIALIPRPLQWFYLFWTLRSDLHGSDKKTKNPSEIKKWNIEMPFSKKWETKYMIELNEEWNQWQKYNTVDQGQHKNQCICLSPGELGDIGHWERETELNFSHF